MRLRQNVTYQAFDGEIVVVDLGTGRYHSVRGPGADIFLMAIVGATPGQVSSALGPAWGTTASAVASDVSSFLSALSEAGILEDGGTPPSSVVAPATARGKYSSPSIESYDDMQSLLLLDPVHDVGELGWPIKA